MAFGDNPKVDDNSIRSEHSVIAVKYILSRRNGFIFKDETPDYGVDLDVELMDNDQSATSHKFPVQIKSTKLIKTVRKDETEYITYPFETSRLSYLCKRIPAYGIITLYDEGSDNTYFDYVDEVVARLDKNKVDWKKQDSVTIYLPKQILDKESAQEIHVRMSARFKNQELLVFSHGSSYDIPVFNTNPANKTSDTSIDFNNPKQVKEFLEEYGLNFLNNDTIDMLLQLLESLPVAYINNSSKLLVLSALTYGRAGYVIETESFLRKCANLISVLSPEEQELLEATRIRTLYLKGEINETVFIKRLGILLEKSTSKVNSINFKINILYLKLIETIHGNEFDYSIISQIDELALAIEGADIGEESKLLLTLFNCENLQMYTDHIFSKEATRIKLQEKLGVLPSLEWRAKRVRLFLFLMERATRPAIEIFRKFRNSDNRRIIGYSLLSIAKAFQITQFTQMTLHIGEQSELIEGQDKAYAENENAALSASQHLFACNLFKEAHQALGIAYDIKRMGELRFGLDTGTATFEDIQHNLSHIEKLTGIKPFKSVVEEAFDSLSTIIKEGGKALHDYSSAEVMLLAKSLLEAYNLPSERLSNILLDIENHQLFDRYAGATEYELLHNQNSASLGSMLEAYREEPVYRLRNKRTDLISLPSRNLQHLLQAHGLMPK
jgi:hypothetical protein